MPPLDIAFLLGSPDISGGSNVIFEHAYGLGARGHRVTIVTERPFDPERLRWHERGQALTFLDHAACRDRAFDVAVATWWRTVFDLPFVPARRLAYFVQSIETRFADPADHESRALAEFSYRLPLAFVTEATWIQRYLRDHYGRDAALVPNGIHKHLFTTAGPVLDETRPQGLRVLVEGPTDVPFKRVPLAITLCRQAGIRDIWLLTHSDCEQYPGVSRVLRRLPITEVPAVYRSCDVLVKLSTVEGMFGPPLEMMHCGGTCVTSDVTGADEYIRDGENALVVPRGEEHRAVEALRRLASDPALLVRLRRGALATAASWPGWDASVERMEAALAAAVTAPDDAGVLRDELRQVLRAALDLGAPLRVAREHDRAAWHLDYPGHTLLRIGKRLVRESIARTMHRGQAESPTNGGGPSAAAPLPEPSRSTPRAPRAGVRVCFVGAPARHRAHAPLDGTAFAATFVDVDGGLGPQTVAAIRDFAPDWTVVFTPERLTPALRAALPGAVVGIVTSALTPADVDALRLAFPLAAPADRAACLVHPDVHELGRLVAVGVNAVAAFLPPVDTATFADDAEPTSWHARPIAALVVADRATTMIRAREVLRAHAGIVEVVAPSSELVLAPLLRLARTSVHMVQPDPLLPAKIVRDLVAGCLVVAPRLAVDHGLMGGEHYLSFEREDEVPRLVELALLGAQRFDVVRQVGRERARELAPGRRYLDLFAQLTAPSSGVVSGAVAS